MIKDFDAQRFANVVRKAQGNRTQKSFALECGISIPRMCNMINGKISHVFGVQINCIYAPKKIS